MTEERVGRDMLPRVVAVGVEVGDSAGVVVDSFEFCLGTLLANPPFAEARAVIEQREGDVLRLAYLEVEEEEDA